MFKSLKNRFFCLLLVLLPVTLWSQICPKDSNYYNITYTGYSNNTPTECIPTPENEVVALSQYSVNASFITKFTVDGGIIWSNEYVPDYPYLTAQSFPWYSNTQINGIIPGDSSTLFAYGQSYEHGRSINNVEYPGQHWVGFIIHIDRYGGVINGIYLGNWGTNYSVNSLIRTADGNMVAYMRSLADPFISKVISIDKNGGMPWGFPVQTTLMYSEEIAVNPILMQRSNGNIVVAREMHRAVDDTIFQPFFTIILRAPLTYFHLFELDGTTGKLLWEASYQCPMVAGTIIPTTYIPRIKNLTELPNGNVSILADMVVPDDNNSFWEHVKMKRRAANFIFRSEGLFAKLITYAQADLPSGLEYSRPIGSNGDQLMLAKDISNQRLTLFRINQDANVTWDKEYINANPAETSVSIMAEKPNGKGFFVFQSEPYTANFHLSVTNSLGNNPCGQLTGALVTEEVLWAWPAGKIKMRTLPFIPDFGYSNTFAIKKKPHGLDPHIDCEYQETCCKDVIDSLHPHEVSICEGETYTLPDNTPVRKAGTYYVTDKTTRGCDSITFYNLKIIKSPYHLFASPDTCLNDASSIQLSATDGYETYWWNNNPSDQPTYSVNTTGTYQVRVENICGSKTDTIQVYDHCDFPIYFPSGFTPNGDQLNDILRVPPQNRNRLKRLTIFNRWGQMTYNTTSPGDGWDGNSSGIPQPMGVYVYFLEMEGLSGRKVTQRGTFVLIR